MLITVLSSKSYKDKSKNHGDCFIIDNGNEVLVYDCGSEDHATRILNYIEQRKVDKVKLILSHNDSDHFDGIPLLLEKDKVSKIYTVLLLKYKDKLLDLIGDNRKTRESIGRQITEKYSNIAKLGGVGILENISIGTEVIKGVLIKGPDKKYFLEAFAKALDSREGDIIDQETIVNATSVQVSVDIGNEKLLLSGDSSFAAIEDKVKDFTYIQLPHHGKIKQAEKIFEAKNGSNDTTYIVSDNTGESNGGSDNLPKRGYDIKNTKNGDIKINENFSSRCLAGTYCKGEIV